jgi:hypothetical protein
MMRIFVHKNLGTGVNYIHAIVTLHKNLNLNISD